MARILIAEDETGLRVAMAGWLAASGHRVIACEDGEKAWQELGSMAPERPDVLVLDVQMPRLGGIAFLARCDAAGQPIPCILVTGRPDLPELLALAQSGRARVLAKPFSLKELSAAVAPA